MKGAAISAILLCGALVVGASLPAYAPSLQAADNASHGSYCFQPNYLNSTPLELAVNHCQRCAFAVANMAGSSAFPIAAISKGFTSLSNVVSPGRGLVPSALSASPAAVIEPVMTLIVLFLVIMALCVAIHIVKIMGKNKQIAALERQLAVLQLENTQHQQENMELRIRLREVEDIIIRAATDSEGEEEDDDEMLPLSESLSEEEGGAGHGAEEGLPVMAEQQGEAVQLGNLPAAVPPVMPPHLAQQVAPFYNLLQNEHLQQALNARNVDNIITHLPDGAVQSVCNIHFLEIDSIHGAAPSQQQGTQKAAVALALVYRFHMNADQAEQLDARLRHYMYGARSAKFSTATGRVYDRATWESLQLEAFHQAFTQGMNYTSHAQYKTAKVGAFVIVGRLTHALGEHFMALPAVA